MEGKTIEWDYFTSLVPWPTIACWSRAKALSPLAVHTVFGFLGGGCVCTRRCDVAWLLLLGIAIPATLLDVLESRASRRELPACHRAFFTIEGWNNCVSTAIVNESCLDTRNSRRALHYVNSIVER